MPGLIPQVVRHFRTPRKYHTPRATQEDLGVKQDVVIGSALHELFDRLDKIEREILPMPARREQTVRELFQVMGKSA